MNSKPLALLGSARKESDTGKCLNLLLGGDEVALVDLLDHNISHYCYKGQYPKNDSFLEVVALMLQHERIVFATPVYWYSMSGILKVFFDRMTDLVTIHKEIGRKMIGKKTFLVAAGADDHLPQGFTEPFRLTAHYFDMEFVDSIYCKTPGFNVKGNEAEAFIKSLAP